MLRAAILAYALLCLLGAVALALFQSSGFAPLLVYLAVNGAVITLAVLFERHRYQPKVSHEGDWQTTAERFIDERTGKLMEVRYNPRTGERAYVEADTKE